MEYIGHIIILINIYIILTVSTGLIVGLSRMISLGQAAFYGIGAYITALCILVLDLSLIPSLLIVMLVNAGISLLLAIPAIRLKGDFFILATLAFQFIVYALLNNLTDLTRGSYGIGGIGPAYLFGDTMISNTTSFIVLSIIMVVVILTVFYLIYHSPFGTVLRAIRDDETTLQTMGRNTRNKKIIAFIISSAFLGWASYLYATYMTYIHPGGFHLDESIFILIAVLLGGSGTIRGAVAGAIFVILLPELLRYAGISDSISASVNQMIFGLILILIMRFRPNGILGELKL